MSPFEFVFALFGLLIGLSYAEVLGGLARVLKVKGQARIGWLTPLFALMLLINLTLFWYASWNFRDAAMPTRGALLQMLGMSGTYFLAASMAFPESPRAGENLDDYFMENKKVAVTAIMACNLFGLAMYGNESDWQLSAAWWTINLTFLATLVLTALTPSRRVALVALGALVSVHLVGLMFQ